MNNLFEEIYGVRFVLGDSSGKNKMENLDPQLLARVFVPSSDRDALQSFSSQETLIKMFGAIGVEREQVDFQVVDVEFLNRELPIDSARSGPVLMAMGSWGWPQGRLQKGSATLYVLAGPWQFQSDPNTKRVCWDVLKEIKSQLSVSS